MTIYDAYGKPVDLAALRTELAVPSLTGIRQVISDHPAQGLTPRRLANLLREAEYGEPMRYLELAEEMEEKDLHYRSVLGTRKLAVAGLEIVVESATDDAKDVAAADLVREVLFAEGIEDVLTDVLDAVGKGFSVNEILWDTSGKRWMPAQIQWRDPRWFLFDPADGRTVLLRDDKAPMGMPLPPYKFIVHTPRIKSGLPLRGGLARAAAWAYLFKNFGIKDWIAFAEIYGQPLRVGKYTAGAAQKEDIDILKTAVANIGSDAAAVIPDTMIIEFIDHVGKAASAQIYERLLDYLDKQVSKAVLGHTGSADSTPGKLGGDDQAKDVRRDLVVADAKQLCATLNRQLVRAVVDLNLGPRAVYPRMRLQLEEAEDLAALASNLDILVSLGVEVEESWVRDKYGIPEAAAGAKLLKSSGFPQAPSGEIPTEGMPPAGTLHAGAASRAVRSRSCCPSCGSARAAVAAPEDVADAYAARAGAEALPLMDGLFEPVRALLSRAKSMEEVRDGLLELYGAAMDPAELGELIARATAAAELAGRYEISVAR